MTYRSALITGASSGIGEALARALPHQTGLVLTGRDAGRLAALADGLARDGRRIDTVTADLATDAGRDAVIAAGEAADIDLLVNNAGLGAVGRVTDNTADDERAMVEVNVVAPVVLTRALLPGMLARSRAPGRRRPGVILLASVAGFMPLPRFATYAASKAFDLHYAEALGAELAGEADVVAVCPGPTRTRFGDRAGMGDYLDRTGMAPARIATAALAALGRRRVVVVGVANTGVTLVPRLLPRRLLSSLTGRAMQRRF